MRKVLTTAAVLLALSLTACAHNAVQGDGEQFKQVGASEHMQMMQDKSEPTKPAMSMDMDKHMSQMRENMKNMHEQMEKIRATTDPRERQKLMQEHMQTMQENMKAMRGMGGPMMGSDHHGGMAMGEHKDKAGGDMMKSHEMMKHNEMMEKRMDMMQMMMEQMMQHIQMTEPLAEH